MNLEPNRITRTDQDVFGAGGLANAPAFFGSPQLGPYIERQESQGQRELLTSEDLPTDTNGTDRDFLALGFVFGEPREDDPLFRPATLPHGWRREGGDHAMWSHLIDEKSRRRVAIFYKASFYDRRARMRLVCSTERLDAAIYDDSEPSGLEFDELLTVDTAKAHLTRERQACVESIQFFPDESSESRIYYEKLLARIDKLISFLPAGGSRL